MSRLGLLAVLLITCQVLFEGVAAQAGSSNRIKYRLPTTVKPNHYDLFLEPDLKNFVFSGEAKIQITVENEINNLILNAKNLNVSNAVIEGSDNKVVPHDDIQMNDEEELLIIPLNSKLAKAQYTLSINFTGELNDKKKGFYRSRSVDKDNNANYIATTHFEPTGARWAFPCWDEPAFKATFQVTLKHPNGTSAISNTEQDGGSMAVGDKLITTFRKTPKMSTYLVAFVVSDYGFKEEDKFRVWTKPNAVEQAKYGLEAGKALMEILNTYTKINYNASMAKMDQISIKDFSAGAMENWGLVTYRETALLYEEGVTTLRSKQSITTVIAHEFAHQWFGNLVSPKWWKYIWLNEGFADYLQYFIAHEWRKDWRLDEVFAVENTQGTAFAADAVKSVRPMNHDAQSPSEISKLFDSIAYQKSGAVIRMMSHILTDDVFRQGLTVYLNTFNHSVAESYNLFDVLQKESNWTWQDVKFPQVMDAWVNKSGYPVVTVKRTKDTTVEVSQERFLLDGTTDDTKWWVPLTFSTASKLNFANTTTVDWLKPDDASKTIDIGSKDWFIFNNLQTGYYRVNYDEENWEQLEKVLKENHTLIVPVNRAQLIDDALNLARANRLKYTTALSLSNYLHKEADYIPWLAAFRNLNFLHNMLRTSEHYDLFKLYVKYITKSLVDDVHFELEQGKDDTDLQKLLRVNLVKWACTAGLDECKSFAKKEFESWLNSTKVDVNLKNNIICAGLRTASKDDWNKTKNILMDIKDEDERRSQLALLACSESTDILKEFLNSTIKEESDPSFSSAVQAVVSEHQNGVDIAMEMLNSEYKRIKQLSNAEEVITSTVQSIARGVTKAEQYDWLNRFVARQGLKAEDLKSVVESASKNMDWVDSYEEEIEKWLMGNEKLFSSSASVAFASILVLVLSVFITRFY